MILVKYNLSNILRSQGRLKEAKVCIDKGIKEDSKDPDLHAFLCLILNLILFFTGVSIQAS